MGARLRAQPDASKPLRKGLALTNAAPRRATVAAQSKGRAFKFLAAWDRLSSLSIRVGRAKAPLASAKAPLASAHPTLSLASQGGHPITGPNEKLQTSTGWKACPSSLYILLLHYLRPQRTFVI